MRSAFSKHYAHERNGQPFAGRFAKRTQVLRQPVPAKGVFRYNIALAIAKEFE